MASLGINVDREGRSDPRTVAGLGATWVRIVAMGAHDLTAYLSDCRAQGLRVLLVLARESFAGIGGLPLYRDRYGALVDAIQVGNEPDLVSPSSWTMTPGELMALGKAVRGVFPATPLVCAGLASGHPEWLDGADLSWCDAIACHPYLKDAPNRDDLEDLPDIDALLRAYQRFGKPILATEWGWWDDREPRASEETRDMVRWAAGTDLCEAFFWFCHSDAMVPPFGLLRADGGEKPRAGVFREEAAKAIPSPWPGRTSAPEQPPDPWRHWSAERIADTLNCPVAAVREHWPRIHAQLALCGIDDRPVQAAMLATVAIETARTFAPVREAFWLSEEWRRANLRYWPHYGRGFIQLTWPSNYATYARKLDDLWGDGAPDIAADPDLALDPDLASAVAALYFRDHGGDEQQLIPQAARRGDWRDVRRLVQGGDAGLADLTAMATALLGTADPPPAADPRDETIAGLSTALAHVCDVIVPQAAAAAEQRERALAEARRIREQFLGA